MFKGLAYGLSIGSFRGGPTFPAMFLGAAAGVMASHLAGFDLTPAVAVGIGAGTVAVLRLPLSSVVLATVLTGQSGLGVGPLIIVGVVVAYLVANLIDPRPEAPDPTPSPRRRPLDRRVESPHPHDAEMPAARRLGSLMAWRVPDRARPRMNASEGRTATTWSVLVVLAAAQFLMVLDQSVMNVSISQLVADFDTTVTTIQAVITLYSLVMAALMITGGKLGDILGRKRAFKIGLVIYGVGSALTAVSWSVPSLTLGWSILEGIGAALVLPALVALTAGNYSGKARATAYGVLGGVAGAGIAVGPILGGWMTTNLTWRLVFVGEVVLVVAILIGTRMMREPEAEERPARARLGRLGALARAASG